MKQTKYFGMLALLLIGGIVGCTCMPAASPLSSAELPTDTTAPRPPPSHYQLIR